MGNISARMRLEFTTSTAKWHHLTLGGAATCVVTPDGPRIILPLRGCSCALALDRPISDCTRVSRLREVKQFAVEPSGLIGAASYQPNSQTSNSKPAMRRNAMRKPQSSRRRLEMSATWPMRTWPTRRSASVQRTSDRVHVLASSCPEGAASERVDMEIRAASRTEVAQLKCRTPGTGKFAPVS